jgi:hypothetical protein
MYPNTFDIDELKRNLDYDEEMQKKSTENKTKSEVNAILKKEILKKQQAAKARTNHKRKSKIDRVLSDGDEVIELVDNSTSNDVKEKENVAKEVTSRRERRPRGATKKQEIGIGPIKTETETAPAMEVSLIELAVNNPPIILDNPEEASVPGDLVQSDSGIKILENRLLDKSEIILIYQNFMQNSSDFDNFEESFMDIDYTCPNGSKDVAVKVELPAFESFQNKQPGILDLSDLSEYPADFYSSFFPKNLQNNKNIPCKESFIDQTNDDFFNELDVGNEVTIDVQSEQDNKSVCDYPEESVTMIEDSNISAESDGNQSSSIDVTVQEKVVDERQLILKKREEEDALEISNQFANQEAQSEDLNITDPQDQKENVSITETYFAQDCSIEIPQGVVENVEKDTTIEIDCGNKETKLEVVTDSQENLLLENKNEIQEISPTPNVSSDEKEDEVIPVKRARLNRILA